MAKTSIKPRIQPLGENILIEPQSAEKKTETGIYLPQSSATERRQQGKVVAIGDDKKITVKKGDVVIFKQFGANEEVSMHGTDYLIVNYKDVLAVIV